MEDVKALQVWDALGRMNGGSVAVRVARVLDKIGSNLLDPNTDPEAKREMAIVITYVPTRGSRAKPAVEVVVKAKLAGEASELSAARVIEGSDGVTYILEDPEPSRDPRQAALFDPPAIVVVDMAQGAKGDA